MLSALCRIRTTVGKHFLLEQEPVPLRRVSGGEGGKLAKKTRNQHKHFLDMVSLDDCWIG